MDTTLEKRVLSRLNAQYVFMPSVSGESICEFLYNKLLLPEIHFDPPEASSVLTSPTPKRKADQIVSPSNKNTLGVDRSMRVSRAFGERFNKQICEMFGTYIEPRSIKKSAEKVEQDTSVELLTEEQGSFRKQFVPGTIKDVICMHASWGVDFE